MACPDEDVEAAGFADTEPPDIVAFRAFSRAAVVSVKPAESTASSRWSSDRGYWAGRLRDLCLGHPAKTVRAHPPPGSMVSGPGWRRAASKSSCRHLSCVDAAEDELRRGVNMAVLSGATTSQGTLTWAEGRG